MKTSTWILASLVGLSSSFAHAQYVGPTTAPSAAPGAATAKVASSTVKALLATGKDDAQVSLQGKIVRHLGGENYRFADSSGEIDLEIEAKHWPANTPIDDKTEVRVQGEFEKGLVRKPRIEVERIEKLK